MSETITAPSTREGLARDSGTFLSERERRASAGRNRLNVGEYERWASVLGGGMLALYGLRRGSWGGLALAALGGMLVQRGVSGHCSCYAALGINTAHRPQGPMA